MKAFSVILFVILSCGVLSAQQSMKFKMDSLVFTDSDFSISFKNPSLLANDSLLNKEPFDLRQLPNYHFNQDNMPIYMPKGKWKKRIFKVDSVDRFSMIIKKPL